MKDDKIETGWTGTYSYSGDNALPCKKMKLINMHSYDFLTKVIQLNCRMLSLTLYSRGREEHIV